MGASNGAPVPWSVACDSPCCDNSHNFLVEPHQATRLGIAIATVENQFKEADVPSDMKGFTRMEVVCSSELDTYRINRWSKDETDMRLSQHLEALPPNVSSMMPLAPPEGYLADSPDGQTVLDLGDTAELLEDFDPTIPSRAMNGGGL
ncbi:unnamed protein product [Effrenium voratum]|nr:unnamed protein product [Effrenium voratum]